ncbi:MAG: exodeoxyribonuclease VII large subunit [Elusimicrobiota bacterium]|jgi:exodeoxyribonuclease VII large subunit|nr:exodeoxyribonuclease VII large subunit [Elusimicrobiota bacterium]
MKELNFGENAGGRIQDGFPVYTVSQINEEIKELFETAYPSVCIEGEISDFKSYQSGHFYFYLKDEKSQIKAVMFAYNNNSLKFEPANGMKVLAFGRLSAYPARGDYQIIVSKMEEIGTGVLFREFEKLKKKLAALGFFDEERKRQIPVLVNKIGIVTSADGAALRDILKVLDSFNAEIEVLIAPARVQGNEAPKEIAAAIELLNDKYGILDVLLVGRGGGSLEDLWAFNTEITARAIFNSKIPVISCIGHETDWTIADWTADLRAPTPSAAAEIVIRKKLEAAELLKDLKENLAYKMESIFTEKKNRFDFASSHRAFVSPHLIYEDKIKRIDEISQKIQAAISKFIQSKEEKLSEMSRVLNILSPQTILNRGYAVARDECGKILKDSAEIKKGDKTEIKLAKGAFKAEAEEILDR